MVSCILFSSKLVLIDIFLLSNIYSNLEQSGKFAEKFDQQVSKQSVAIRLEPNGTTKNGKFE